MNVPAKIFATVAGVLSILPAAASLSSSMPHCKVQANFTLIAHAPGQVVDGWAVAANIYDNYLSVSPKDATEAQEDNFAPVTFFKTDANKNQLYMYFQGQSMTVASPIDGNLQGSTDPNADGLPYYDGKFTADIEGMPPGGYINFHPGVLKNPGNFGQSPNAIGGFFACYDNSFDDYYVWGGTYAFQTSTFYPNPSLGCIAFKPKIEITGFGANCHL